MPKPTKPAIITLSDIWSMLEYMNDTAVDNQEQIKIQLTQQQIEIAKVNQNKNKIELPRRQN